MLSNAYRTVLYVGVTSNIHQRLEQHKRGHGSKFCKKYKVLDLIYFEEFDSISDAIYREKQLKKWNRSWKLDLIRKVNPTLKELRDDHLF